MSAILTGPEGFSFARRAAGPSRPIERLAKVSRAGQLMFVVDRYEITFADGSEEEVNLEHLEHVLGMDEDCELGFYEAPDLDTEPNALLETLREGETEKHADALRRHFEDRKPVQITVYANVVYRLHQQDDWDAMLKFLNERLAEDAQLSIEDMGDFDVDAMIRFDPEEDEPDDADGTAHIAALREQDDVDDGLPLLGLCILAHAVVHDLECLDVEEEPLHKCELWSADA
jgi:hypothetical protein